MKQNRENVCETITAIRVKRKNDKVLQKIKPNWGKWDLICRCCLSVGPLVSPRFGNFSKKEVSRVI